MHRAYGTRFCESCRHRPPAVDLAADPDLVTYRLCSPCYERFTNAALRPLEYFNLAARHFKAGLLGDDFYDFETGEALQPEIEVTDAELFPFPTFREVRHDAERLLDFAFVQYYLSEEVVQALRGFDPEGVLRSLQVRVVDDREVGAQAYEIAAKVLGRRAEDWIKQEWVRRRPGELFPFAEALASCLDPDEGFALVTQDLEGHDDASLSAHVSALLHFRSARTLAWIECVSPRIAAVSSDWGQLAASSQFTWAVAERWLERGRPLSLIALDALHFCTSSGRRANQSLWLQNLDPSLPDHPGQAAIAARLREYLASDGVPRVRQLVAAILR